MEKDFVINVLNKNEAPISLTFLSTGAAVSFYSDNPTIPENTAIGTVAGTIQAEDVDQSQTLSFTMVKNAGGLFGLAPPSKVVCSKVCGPTLDFWQIKMTSNLDTGRLL